MLTLICRKVFQCSSVPNHLRADVEKFLRPGQAVASARNTSKCLKTPCGIRSAEGEYLSLSLWGGSDFDRSSSASTRPSARAAWKPVTFRGLLGSVVTYFRMKSILRHSCAHADELHSALKRQCAVRQPQCDPSERVGRGEGSRWDCPSSFRELHADITRGLPYGFWVHNSGLTPHAADGCEER
ncbi:hypothetical protein AOLI_G00294300 [Acnodon oligacanthus]